MKIQRYNTHQQKSCPIEISNQTIACYVADFVYDEDRYKIKNPQVLYFIAKAHIVLKADGTLFKSIDPSKDVVENIKLLQKIEEDFKIQKTQKDIKDSVDLVSIMLTVRQKEIIYSLALLNKASVEESVADDIRAILKVMQ